jgi:hypothetical protein
MGLPDATLAIQDGALGILPASVDSAHVKIGVCSTGAQNVLQSFSDLATLKSTMGVGPLVQAAGLALTTTVKGRGARPVYVMRVAPTTAGACGAVTKTAVGSSTGTVTVAGAAFDAFQVRVLITRTGTLNVGAFKYSMDGGDTYSTEITIPGGGTYLIPDSNVTLTFVPGGGAVFFEALDVHVFNTTAPEFTTSDLTTTMAALLADSTTWGFIHLVGAPQSGNDATKSAASATIAAAMATHMSTAEAASRYGFCLMDAPDVANDSSGDTALDAAFVNFSNTRVGVGAGYSEQVSAVDGRIYRRPDNWTVAARVACIPVHEQPSRVDSGPVTGIVTQGRDERVREYLDAKRFSTLRTHIGKQGSYITSGRLMAANGSDFQLIPNRRVIDKACTAARAAMLKFLDDDLLVNGTSSTVAAGQPGAPGTIADSEAIRVENYVRSQVESALQGSVSSVQVVCNRSDAILTTQNLRLTIRVIPKGYARFITATIGLSNPANAA